MRFWKNLINMLNDIFNQVRNLNEILFREHFKANYIPNENPIKEVKTSPLLLLEHNDSRKKLIIQNIGLEPCYIKLEEGMSKNDFHFVLAPDTSPAFGNGGSVTLDNWHGEVYAMCEKETKISVLEY